jgi:Protein of unknown function (DUF2752)
VAKIGSLNTANTVARRWSWCKLALLAAPATAWSWPSTINFTTSGWWSCPIRNFTGCPCPTCGMTRAVMAIGHGQWSAAWHYHAFSFGLFAGCVLVGSHAAAELVWNRSISTAYPKLLTPPVWYLGFGITYFLYYFYRLYYRLIP